MLGYTLGKMRNYLEEFNSNAQVRKERIDDLRLNSSQLRAFTMGSLRNFQSLKDMIEPGTKVHLFEENGVELGFELSGPEQRYARGISSEWNEVARVLTGLTIVCRLVIPKKYSLSGVLTAKKHVLCDYHSGNGWGFILPTLDQVDSVEKEIYNLTH